jgi:ankyrin repeat protein
VENIKEKMPQNNKGNTPFHSAASNGHLGICKFIMESTEEKNPRNAKGDVPLHMAARNGHLNIYRYIRMVVIKIQQMIWATHHFIRQLYTDI